MGASHADSTSVLVTGIWTPCLLQASIPYVEGGKPPIQNTVIVLGRGEMLS